MLCFLLKIIILFFIFFSVRFLKDYFRFIYLLIKLAKLDYQITDVEIIIFLPQQRAFSSHLFYFHSILKSKWFFLNSFFHLILFLSITKHNQHYIFMLHQIFIMIAHSINFKFRTNAVNLLFASEIYLFTFQLPNVQLELLVLLF